MTEINTGDSNQILTLLEHGFYQEAFDFSRSVDLGEEMPRLCHDHLNHLYEQRHYEEADAFVIKVSSLVEGDADFHYVAFQVSKALNQNEMARVRLEKAVASNSDNLQWNIELADFFFQLKRPQECGEFLQKAMDLKPYNQGVNSKLASLLYAFERYEEAVEFAPGDSFINWQLIQVLFLQQRYESVKKCISKTGNSYEESIAEAFISSALGQGEKARSVFEQLCFDTCSDERDSPRAWYSLAQIHRQHNRIQEEYACIKMMEHIIEKKPSFALSDQEMFWGFGRGLSNQDLLEIAQERIIEIESQSGPGELKNKITKINNVYANGYELLRYG